MSQTDPAASGGRDPLYLALLFAGTGLALVVAFALPALHFRGADKALLGISTWEAVPFLTLIKIAFLGLAVAAAFMPRLAPLRLPLTLAAALLMFMPAIGAMAAAVYQWSELRAEIVALSGNRTPWVDPGWGLIALLVASIMVCGAVWRAYRMSGDTSAA
jgi:hypothetical protein